jgi:tRNA-dihydrouridine synthase
MAAIDRALEGDGIEQEPDLAYRLDVVLQHFSDTLKFYGDAWGLKIFRKHLGWYVEQALMPVDPALRRAAKARLCQIQQPKAVELSLAALWADSALPMSAIVTM